jgi:hypothetical protein
MLLFNMDRNSNLVVTLFTITDIYCSSCHDRLSENPVETAVQEFLKILGRTCRQYNWLHDGIASLPDSYQMDVGGGPIRRGITSM